jgi:hypothetical protein
VRHYEEADVAFKRANRVFLRIIHRTLIDEDTAYEAAGVGPADTHWIATGNARRALLKRLVDRTCEGGNDVDLVLVRGAIVSAIEPPRAAND